MDASITRTVRPIWQGSVLAALTGMLLAACGAAAPGQRATEYLDESSGVTITRVAAPFTFYSDDPSRAANARDYLDAAPLALNRSGRYSWWLWLGEWSTIDRGASGGDSRLPDIAVLQLIVDGEPMELDIQARTGRIPGAGPLPYVGTLDTAKSILLPLTSSQVARLSRAASISIRTEMTDGEVRHWQPWPRRASWTNFVEIAAVHPGELP
jgi:hypothetical protein